MAKKQRRLYSLPVRHDIIKRHLLLDARDRREAEFIANQLLGEMPYNPSKERGINTAFLNHSQSNTTLVYSIPKQWREKKVCDDCGRPISDSSGRRCSQCFRKESMDEYKEKLFWYYYWFGTAKGNYWPTESEIYVNFNHEINPDESVASFQEKWAHILDESSEPLKSIDASLCKIKALCNYPWHHSSDNIRWLWDYLIARKAEIMELEKYDVAM